MRAICLALVLIAIWTSVAAGELNGTADRIADGDTFWLYNSGACTKIRLCGINAPERGQLGYVEAGRVLAELVQAKIVRCRQVGSGTVCDGRSRATNRERIVAQCFTTDGHDIAAALVERHAACDWVRFSGGAYSTEHGRRCRGTISGQRSQP